MGTRNIIQAPVTYNSMAMNAAVYGFAEHSAVTPHHAVKQLWWTENRIHSKIDIKYITSCFRGFDKDLLEQPVGHGEDLTDDTYLTWILHRARRWLLILVQVKRVERIFDLIDHGWQDEDLPLDKCDVERLGLDQEKNEQLNRKFYEAQFQYLLRPIKKGTHVEYGPNEHIPMEYYFTMPHAASLKRWSRVHFPDQPTKLYTRRHFDLLDDEKTAQNELDFLQDVQRTRSLPHEHICRIWASYTSEGSGYTLTDFVPGHTMRSFLETRNPPQFSNLSREKRPLLLFRWMHCLADTVAFLHNRGEHHGAIRPTNILIDEDNHIAFSDLGRLRTFMKDKIASKQDNRDYSAPETGADYIPSANAYFSFGHGDSSSIHSAVSHANPSRGSQFSSFSSASSATVMPGSPPLPSPASPRNFSRNFVSSRKDSGYDLDKRVSPNPSPPPTPSSPYDVFTDYASVRSSLPTPCLSSTSSLPQASDVFSLACVYLDILTFLVHGKLTPLVKVRNKKHTSSSNSTSAETASISAASLASRKSTSSNNSEPFHACTERLDGYLADLRKSLKRQPPRLAGAVDAVLRTVRMMLSQNPAARPSALEVREQLEYALATHLGYREMCCRGRNWDKAADPPNPVAAQTLIDAIARCRRKLPVEPPETLVEDCNEDSEDEGTATPDDPDYMPRSSFESFENRRDNKRGGMRLFRSFRGPTMKLP